MLQMDGFDTDSDGKIDSWGCDDDYGDKGVDDEDKPNCIPDTSFVPISTPNINIVDLQFFVAPIDDPYKAYEESGDIMQPHVTILMRGEVPQGRMQFLNGHTPFIDLQTTVTARVFSEVTLYDNQ